MQMNGYSFLNSGSVSHRLAVSDSTCSAKGGMPQAPNVAYGTSSMRPVGVAKPGWPSARSRPFSYLRYVAQKSSYS